MSEPRAIYDANTAVLSDLPESARAAAHLVEKNANTDAGLILVQCMAAVSHPDHVVSLAMLGALPKEHKQAALELITYGLTYGYTLSEQSAMHGFVQPIIARAARLAPR